MKKVPVMVWHCGECAHQLRVSDDTTALVCANSHCPQVAYEWRQAVEPDAPAPQAA